MYRAWEFGGASAAFGGAAMPRSLRLAVAMLLCLRGECGFANMEVLRAVGTGFAFGALVPLARPLCSELQ